MEWYCARGEKRDGPIRSQEINGLIQAGKLGANDLVWEPGMENWVPVTSLAMFRDALPSSAQPSPAPASKPTSKKKFVIKRSQMPRSPSAPLDGPRPGDSPYAPPGSEFHESRERYSGNIPTHLAPSILVTLFCCTIGGIVAIVHASKVNGHIARRNYRAAQDESEAAKSGVAFHLGSALSLLCSK